MATCAAVMTAAPTQMCCSPEMYGCSQMYCSPERAATTERTAATENHERFAYTLPSPRRKWSFASSAATMAATPRCTRSTRGLTPCLPSSPRWRTTSRTTRCSEPPATSQPCSPGRGIYRLQCSAGRRTATDDSSSSVEPGAAAAYCCCALQRFAEQASVDCELNIRHPATTPGQVLPGVSGRRTRRGP